MRPILVIGAVADEVYPLANSFQSRSRTVIGGREAFRGKIAGKEAVAVITGPGQVNAVQGLTAAIEKINPRLVIQAGCGGAFRPSALAIGDIGIAFEEIDIHLGLEPPESREIPESSFSGTGLELPDPLPFPVLSKNGADYKNRYPVDKSLARWALKLLRRTFEKTVRVAGGPFVTVSTITATERKAALLCERLGPIMESMEGAGAAQICIHYDIPFLEIRAVSNYAGKRDRPSWNLPLAFERSARATRVVIARIGEWMEG